MSTEQIIINVGLLVLIITLNRVSRLIGAIIGVAAATALFIWGILVIDFHEMLSDSARWPMVFMLISVVLYIILILLLIKEIKAAGNRAKLVRLLFQGDELLKTGQRAQAFAIYVDGLRLELKANRPESIKEFKSFERIIDLYTGVDMDTMQASDLARELSRLHCAMHNRNGKMQVQQELDTYIKALPSIDC